MANEKQHVTKLIQYKELNDVEVSYCYRCCDDPSTDSWCTVRVTDTPEVHDYAVSEHQKRIQTQHEAKQQWRARMKAEEAGNAV